MASLDENASGGALKEESSWWIRLGDYILFGLQAMIPMPSTVFGTKSQTADAQEELSVTRIFQLLSASACTAVGVYIADTIQSLRS